MRYLVQARVRPGKEKALLEAIAAGTLGSGSVAGDEYLRNMQQARLVGEGVVTWVEACFCDQPLAEEWPYWSEYFEILEVTDAHERRNCRHENGKEPWACSYCSCTNKLERRLARQGVDFVPALRSVTPDSPPP